jgi:histidinol-phosphate aminotransferase
VWVGTGSNEVLLDACLAYGGPGRTALVFEPTYRMHHRQARAAGTTVVVEKRDDDFRIDVDAALKAIDRHRPHIVFVCSPNNPTGTLTPLDDVRRIAAASDGLVILDEAYYEFSGVTLAGELSDYPNVIVVRTLSKAFRLAGARLGYGLAHPDTLEPLLKVRMPYGQSSLAQAAATVAVRRRDEILSVVPELIAERERITQELARIGAMEVFPSAANFVLFRHPAAGAFLRGLTERGILVRDFTGLDGCEDCLRVTVGTPAENDEFLEAVARLL